MKKLRGNENISVILKEFPKSKEIFEKLNIKLEKGKSLVELSRKYKIPLQILLNHISQKIGVKVDWPKIEGHKLIFDTASSASSKLRDRRPENIKRIIAIHSGKGGVGKTFLTLMLAKFFNKNGYLCGILDLDIDCPNISKVLKIKGRLTANANKRILPMEKGGIKVVSMGNIIEYENEPILWRGPIMAKAIEQLIFDSDWGKLDILLIDLPPGTSDVPLTTLNIIKPDQAILITTPQNTALIDTAKSLAMFNKFGIEIIGIVENMSGDIFGQNEVKKYFKKERVLGSIPLKTIFANYGILNALKNTELNEILKRIKKFLI